MNDTEYDRLLHIKTVGTLEVINHSAHYNRYEATPYKALDELFTEYELIKTDRLVDFGSGKGRLPIYIQHKYHTSVIGIEMSNKLHREALENLKVYTQKSKQKINSISITFVKCLAQDYEIKSNDTVFYFFNPFSVQIFMKVVTNILLSVDQHDRTVDLILYYPTTDYIQFLNTRTPFKFIKEVKVSGLYEHNENERFLIFRFVVHKNK